MKNLSTQTANEDLPKTPLRFFWRMSKPFLFWASIATFFVILAAGASVGLRMLVEFIVDAISENDFVLVATWLLLYPVLYFLITVTWRLSGITAKQWLFGVPKNTTDTLMQYVSRHSHQYFSNRFAGSLSNKISNVSSANEEFVATFLWSYLENLVPLFFTATLFLMTDVWVGGLFVLMVISAVILNVFLMPRKRNFSRELADTQSSTTGLIVDILSNIQAVRQFVSFPTERERLSAKTAEVRQKGNRSFLYSEYMMFASTLLFTAFTIVMFVIVVDKWLAGDISDGRLVSFVLLTNYVSGTVIFLGRIISNSAKLYGRAEEGLTDILLNYEITDLKDAKKLAVPHGEIIWDKVNFKYGETEVFSNLNMTIKSGQRVGLVGTSGAGKSTLVSLLLRQFDINSGNITIDEQNIAKVTQDSLREAIAVVPQEPVLFHRSIKENILYGNPNATIEEVMDAAKKAQAHNFISTLTNGYDTLVGERGVKLSGGQRQRIIIARAILKDTPILILDEATSALDSESEVAIQQALHQLMRDKTVIAIAHRLSTLREMDRIIVLEAGKIVEDGTHETLKNHGGIYQKLWEHQAGGFVGE